MDEWHYMRGETTFGPISGVMLHSLVKRGRLQNDSRVRRAGEAGWSTIAEVLPGLPPVPDSPLPAEQPASALPFDSTLPGASVVYAPPQSALDARPHTGMPAFLWFGMIFCVGSLLFEVQCGISMIFIHLSGHSSMAAWPAWLSKGADVMIHFLNSETSRIAAALGMISIVLWQGCAFASLKRLYSGLVRRSLFSGLWWFVPIANLFMPLFCLRDMRYLSRTRQDVPDPQASVGPLLLTMEALILLPIPLDISAALSPHSLKSGGWDDTITHLVHDVLMIGLSTTLLLIVLSNFLQQRRLYAHWHDDEYWQNPNGQ